MSGMDIDWLNKTAIRVYELPENWAWAQSDSVQGGFMLNGSETKIKTNGERKWIKPLEKFIITTVQVKKTQEEYEKETGNCYQCEGTGQYCCGWNHITGNNYRKCDRCKGCGTKKQIKQELQDDKTD